MDGGDITTARPEVDDGDERRNSTAGPKRPDVECRTSVPYEFSPGIASSSEEGPEQPAIGRRGATLRWIRVALGHWALRWLLMLAIFTASTLAFSLYAGASSDDAADDTPTLVTP